MPTIYISDSDDDKNDGLSPQIPIYSLKRAKQLQGGRNDYSWHFGPRAWIRKRKRANDLFDGTSCCYHTRNPAAAEQSGVLSARLGTRRKRLYGAVA
jgi:hypothetical protein